MQSTAKLLVEQAVATIEASMSNSFWSNMSQTSRQDRQRLVGRYTAAFAAEFQAWLGATYPSVRSDIARFALAKNIRCEFNEDHIDLLYRFARQFDTTIPHADDRAWIYPCLSHVRRLFVCTPQSSNGLRGLAALTIFERASQIFIPILDAAAKTDDIQDRAYTQIHGDADTKHCQELMEALEAEWGEGYHNPHSDVLGACNAASSLVLRIFTCP